MIHRSGERHHEEDTLRGRHLWFEHGKVISVRNEHAPEETKRQDTVESLGAGILLVLPRLTNGTPINLSEPIFTSCGGRAGNIRCFPSTPAPGK